MDIGKMVRRPSTNVEFSNNLMGWSAGYTGYVILLGSTRVCCDARAGVPNDMASFIFKSIKDEGATSGALPCYILPALAEKVEDLNEGQPLLDMLRVGTQPVTREILKNASKVGRRVSVSYASTEMLFIAACPEADPNTFQDYFAGNSFPRVEVKIRNEQGSDVGSNTRGEILVKTPFGFQSYLNDAAATAAAFTEDGFFRTGDVGWYNAEGSLIVEGRSSDAIMRGNYIYYPGWLEARIRSCPAVQDVMVVGVPDVMLNSELCACVVLQSEGSGMDAVREFVANDIQAEDALSPRPRHYVEFDSILLTPSGKPDRREMTKRAAQRVTEADK